MIFTFWYTVTQESTELLVQNRVAHTYPAVFTNLTEAFLVQVQIIAGTIKTLISGPET